MDRFETGKRAGRMRDNRGFSMAETLATVAIIVILLALAVVGIFNLYYSLQQKELDSKAEIIYVAAQDQMTKIMAAGRSGLMAAPSDKYPNGTAHQLEGVPGDATELVDSTGTDTDAQSSGTAKDAKQTNYVTKNSIVFLTSEDYKKAKANNTQNAATILFGDGGLDDELLSRNWVIEYDYRSLTVYAVFYNPDDSNFINNYVSAINSDASVYNGYRTYKGRLDSLKGTGGSKERVGYHGGAGSAGGSDNYNLSPHVIIDNGEKLTATIYCDKPITVTEDLVFEVSVSDKYGNSYDTFYTYGKSYEQLDDSLKARANGFEVVQSIGVATEASLPTGSMCKSGYRYSLKLNLDSLESEDQRFTSLYGSKHKVDANAQSIDDTTPGRQRLVEGSDITVTVTAYCNSNLTVHPGTASDTNNSLFDKDTASGTASISLGRHLQNLDSGSGVVGVQSNITTAVLKSNVVFTQSDDSTADASKDWYKTYGGSNAYFNGKNAANIPLFKPISNNKLTSLDGNGFEIENLYIETKEATATGGVNYAGLFGIASSDSLTLNNLKLVSPCVKCLNSGGDKPAGNAGVLVGTAKSNDLHIENCQIYLSAEDMRNKTQKDSWIKGIQAGGLVGSVQIGKVSITKSSVSTVIGDTSQSGPSEKTTIGGLVGHIEDNGVVEISASYADCYLFGNTVGGLVGSTSSAASKISNSYSAGFLAWSGSAGGILASGSLAKFENSYSIMARLSEGASGRYASSLPCQPTVPAANKNVTHNCFFLATSDVSGDEAGATPVNDSANDISTLLGNLNENSDNGSFTLDESTNSTPYNLMNQGLTSYIWPTIKGLYHYGDWTAGFKEGSLVYYEKYAKISHSGKITKTYSYGFEGANVTSTLKDVGREGGDKFAVVGDGYGIVYDSKSSLPTSVSVSVIDPSTGKNIANDSIDLSKREKYSVDNKYDVFPLSKKDIVNTDVVNDKGYYFKAQLTATKDGGVSQTSTYFFNPHFARTVREAARADAVVPNLGKGNIYIRTARQLYNLSKYYNDYRDGSGSTDDNREGYRNVTKDSTFYQERNIDYSEYEWTDFAAANEAVSSQTPIGRSAASGDTFIAKYNGNCHEITDVSFETSNSGRDYPYVGLFGYIGSVATVENVVLCTDYTPSAESNFHVRYKGDLRGNKTAHLGILAGYNKGTINNCAVSGYYVAGLNGTINSYTNSTVNVGGLVGTNAGKISACSADSPRLRLSSLYSTVYAGGFVGYNMSGATVKNAYSLGAIELTDSKGDNVTNVAGFAGKNEGRISSSYSATALAVSGDNAMSFGFAPKGGYVSGCSYLNNGTYSYIKKMYSYNFNTAQSSATPVTYAKLKAAAPKGHVTAANSLYHSNTATESDVYPYRGVVKNGSGEFVHYGDWQDDVKLGTLGVFYWEHEEGGSNDGYHMTYLGSTAKYNGNNKLVEELTEGTSLCTAHNDGGTITSYGYGFYVQSGDGTNVSAKWDGIDCSSGSSIADVSTIANFNKIASRNLEEQMESEGVEDRNFAFYAFTTRTRSAANGGDYIALSKGTEKQNGSIELTYSNGTAEAVYRFDISPFFANAMAITKSPNNNEIVKEANDRPLEASDGMQTNYASSVGKSESTVSNGKQTAGNPYEIRSVDQLQYINWNGKECSVRKLSTSSNYDQFNYLVSASKITKGSITEQGRSDRADLKWVQTHDVTPIFENDNFVPIAGTYESSNASTGKYSAVMYTWFGGLYNGQNYTVKNLNISSNSFNIGLFGTTLGANIKNVIMYSDNNAAIKRTEDANYKDREGAYSIGGLVGVAFDYEINDLTKSSNYIENCAISGYKIIDASSNCQGLGEANIGGLIGVANINLRQCSAVVDIEEKATYSNGVALYGAFTRIGGLVGGAQGYVKDCYSGGSLSFDSNIAKTVVWGDFVKDDNKKFYICVGGIAGSAFTSTYMNIVNTEDVRDGSPTLENCYTFFKFPTNELKAAPGGKDTKLIMSTVASRADRGGINKGKMTISNCYYYDAIKISDKIEEQYRGTATQCTVGEPSPVTYTQMCGTGEVAPTNETPIITYSSFYNALNKNDANGIWKPATTIDAAQQEIDGKFSFPSNPALEGKNYPFPTVVTQNDLTFGTFTSPVSVNVHYGDWPIANASYWENGRDSIDIFDDHNPKSSDPFAYKEFTLHVNKTEFTKGAPTKGDFLYDDLSNSDIVVVDSITDAGDSTYKVKIKALKEGTTTIKLAGTAAEFSLQVTANLNLSAEVPANATDTRFDADTNILTVDIDNEGRSLDLKAVSGGSNKHDYSESAGLSWSCSKDDGATILDATVKNPNILTVRRSGYGEVMLTVTASYTYNGTPYTKDLYITVADPALLGLSNGTEFNEARDNGKNDSGVNNEKYTDETKPFYSLEGKAANLYLYTTSDQPYFDDASKVSSISVTEKNGTVAKTETHENGVYKQNARYFVSIADEAVTSGSYKFLPVTVAYCGNETSKPVGTVNVAVQLKDGPLLTISLSSDKLAKPNFKTVSFASGVGGTSKSVEVKLPKGAKCTLASYSDESMFGTSNQEIAAKFDAWKLSDSSKIYDVGDTYVVSGDVSFEPLLKHTLTLKVRGSSSTVKSSISFAVGHKGISSLGASVDGKTEYEDWKKGQDLFSAYRLDGWYSRTDTSATKILSADGTPAANDCSFNSSKGSVSNGVLKLDEDAQLYGAWDKWTLASSFEDDGEYIFANKTANSSYWDTDMLLAASAQVIDENKVPSKYFSSNEKPSSDIYKLITTSAKANNSGAIEKRIDENSVWTAQEERIGTNSYYMLRNNETHLYLTDAGGSETGSGATGDYWFQGCIEDSDNNAPLKIDNDMYPAWYRSCYSLKDSTLHVYNRSYIVGFLSGWDNVLFTNKWDSTGGNTYAYVYKKELQFNWPSN